MLEYRAPSRPIRWGVVQNGLTRVKDQLPQRDSARHGRNGNEQRTIIGPEVGRRIVECWQESLKCKRSNDGQAAEDTQNVRRKGASRWDINFSDWFPQIASRYLRLMSKGTL